MIDISVLNNVSRAKKYIQGTVFDSSTTDMHIILQGEAGLIGQNGNSRELSGKLGPGDFFGETPLFLEISMPGTVIALTDIITLPVGKQTAQAFFHDEPALTYELIKALCGRLHATGTAAKKPTSAARPPQKTATVTAPAVIAQEQPDTAKPQSTPPAPSVGSSLLPDGHGVYSLPQGNEDRACLMDKGYTCPVCKNGFTFPTVRPSKLVLESTDSDMRPRYKGIEPLYYDVITCPHCLYSALTDMFDSPNKPKARIAEELKAIKDNCGISFGATTDASTVFAGYYLALFCAPRCFTKHHLITAKLLLKLSRIYQDCKDSPMEAHTAKQALDAYMYVYQNIEIPANQDQQLCLIIGELCLSLGRVKEAKDFFFKAKINRAGAPLLKRQAENRLWDLRPNDA
jgi:uncharacterized protein (DUF2225 family)